MNACEKMDNKFYIDDFEFERYLKEKADEFKMYPSKRVWNSIYNDMHPGSRWPSISMSIILICTLFLIGFLNTNTTNTHNSSNASLAHRSNIPAVSSNIASPENINMSSAANKEATENKTIAALQSSTVNNSIKKQVSTQSYPIRTNTVSVLSNKYSVNTTSSLISSTANNQTANGKVFSNQKDNIAIKGQQLNDNYSATATVTAGIIANDNAENVSIADNSVTGVHQISLIEKNSYYNEIEEKAATDLQTSLLPVKTIAINGEENISGGVKNNSNKLSEADKFWIENYAMYNRPAPKKWKGKLSWQTYFTPSVVYRSLENTAANKNVGVNGLTNNSAIDNSVIHTPSFGIELGTGLQYDLTKRIKFKTGIQLNFTRYNAHAFDNGHPIATSLTMLSDDGNTAYEVFKISPYNSNYGITPVKLHNQTYQFSLPIGADYKIASSDNLEWYAGASIQPTFVLAGRSYLISTDRRNYVRETGMLNRFNLNAGFETYIAIKTKGITWQIGPQFRKQLFSTNQKVYSIEERLLNYGLKIGITKKL